MSLVAVVTAREEIRSMLMRTDPFRELDRVAQQVFGTAARPAAMPIDAPIARVTSSWSCWICPAAIQPRST